MKKEINPWIIPGLPENLLPKKTPAELCESVTLIVCDYFNINIQDVCGPSRKREFSDCRHFAMLLIDKEKGQSYQDIAKFFNRDRSGVYQAVRSAKALIETNKSISKSFSELEKLIT